MSKAAQYKGWTRVSRAVGSALSAAFPGIEHRFSVIDGVLHVEWESANPQVSEPLKLVCEDFPAVFWVHGEIYDFIWGPGMGMTLDGMAQHVVAFLTGFFSEEFVCSWTFERGVTRSGALPIKLSSQETGRLVWEYSGKAVAPDQVVRSWRGRWDQGEFPDSTEGE